MDFSWSEQQRDLYASTLDFARSELRASPEVGADFPRESWRRLGEMGLLGLCVPEDYGGMGLDAVTTARCVEALGRGCTDTGLVFSAAAHLFAAVMPIVEHGSEELKRRLLPKLASGEWIAANAITEAEAGSDVFALKATARPDGEHVVIDGAKSYVTNGPVADVFVFYATRDPAQGFMGVSAFVVHRDTPGLQVGRPIATMGLDSSPISSVYCEGCRVPLADRLGGDGRGAEVFTGSMLWERACLFAAYVGAMDRQLDEVVAHAQQRKQSRKPIGKHQAVSHRIADMLLRLEAARLLLYRACWSRDQGEAAVLEVALAKLAVSEAAVQSALDAIQIHGGMGYAREAGVERALRDAVPGTIFSGTSEVQRNLVARELGL
ncbi:MAG: acyl-CoA dehydrogenase family protein [Myxococcales bacterium]|nr:acyl-CoA dehydrogenase family protein [Myxococcales bacterium]